MEETVERIVELFGHAAQVLEGRNQIVYLLDQRAEESRGAPLTES
jgi:predicted Ser/Thr protein kinase